MKLPVIRLRPLWYLLSALMIGLSILFIGMWGLKQGIEFTGGSLLVARFEQTRPSVSEATAVLNQIPDLKLGSIVAQPVGETDMQFRLPSLTEEEHQKVFGALQQKYASTTEQRFDAIGPVLGEELRQKSVKGLIVALLAIMIYVAYAFRKVSAPVKSWKYGLITLFTAFHDVIVPIGVFAALGHFADVEVGTAFIAAILTVLGYSITDTIVVLDRVRENLQKMSGSFASIVEASVHQTFLRSFNTSMTTLLTLFAIFFFGGASLHEFTLALIIGIAVGTYSSIFVASPLLVTWEEFDRSSKK